MRSYRVCTSGERQPSQYSQNRSRPSATISAPVVSNTLSPKILRMRPLKSGSLRRLRRFGGNSRAITRLRRGDEDIVPTLDTSINYGDRLRVVANDRSYDVMQTLRRAEERLGQSSAKSADQ